jgi:hypothetical protein
MRGYFIKVENLRVIARVNNFQWNPNNIFPIDFGVVLIPSIGSPSPKRAKGDLNKHLIYLSIYLIPSNYMGRTVYIAMVWYMVQWYIWYMVCGIVMVICYDMVFLCRWITSMFILYYLVRKQSFSYNLWPTKQNNNFRLFKNNNCSEIWL